MPVLMLNGTGRITDVRRVFPDTELAEAPRAAWPHCEVRQIIGGFGRSTLDRHPTRLAELRDFVTLATLGQGLPATWGAHRLPATCHAALRRAVTLWEQLAAQRVLRDEGRRTVDETAVTAAIEEQRRLLAGAQATSKAARRALARLPATGPPAEVSATNAGSAPGAVDDEGDGRVPPVVEGEAWRTEFLT